MGSRGSRGLSSALQGAELKRLCSPPGHPGFCPTLPPAAGLQPHHPLHSRARARPSRDLSDTHTHPEARKGLGHLPQRPRGAGAAWASLGPKPDHNEVRKRGSAGVFPKGPFYFNSGSTQKTFLLGLGQVAGHSQHQGPSPSPDRHQSQRSQGGERLGPDRVPGSQERGRKLSAGADWEPAEGATSGSQ